jgi:topoisomerase-4 subunit B
VGVSVVNALSTLVEVHIKRDGSEHRITFRDGDRATPLEVVGTVGKKNTGTRVRFWPTRSTSTRPNSPCAPCAPAARQGRAVPGPDRHLFDEASGERDEWHYEDGLRDYLLGELTGRSCCRPTCSPAT